MYDQSGNYQTDLPALRRETLRKLEEILDSVIIDNEAKIAK
jgi:hypothetical protein